MRNRVFFAAFAVLLSSAAGLALAELTLRLVFPGRVVRAQDVGALAYAFDPDYLVRLKPGIEKRFPAGGEDGQQEIRWRTNADGFRGPELRASGARVLVYGDSNVQARFSALGSSFPARLEAQLIEFTGRDIEVLNAGVVGSGPDQSVLRLERDAPRYRPALAVLVVFADNDFGDLVRNRLFELDAAGALRLSAHERRPDSLLTTGRPTSGWSSLLLVRALRRALEPYPHAAVSFREFAAYRSGEDQRFSHFADHYDSDLALEPDGEAANLKRALLAAVLARGRESARRLGVKLLVVVLPSSRDLVATLSPNFRDFSKHDAYAPENLASFAVAAADQAGLPVLDLFVPFMSAGPAALYRPHDDHWSDAGQALAAELAAKKIVAEDLLE